MSSPAISRAGAAAPQGRPLQLLRHGIHDRHTRTAGTLYAGRMSTRSRLRRRFLNSIDASLVHAPTRPRDFITSPTRVFPGSDRASVRVYMEMQRTRIRRQTTVSCIAFGGVHHRGHAHRSAPESRERLHQASTLLCVPHTTSRTGPPHMPWARALIHCRKLGSPHQEGTFIYAPLPDLDSAVSTSVDMRAGMVSRLHKA